MIPYGRQSISEEDIQAVVEVLRSDFLTQGQKLPEFEAEICKYTDAAHGVAVNSGTSALHLACRALNLGPGDILWTSPITFVASANCALYCGAEVDFVDIDPQTFNLSVEALAEKLDKAEKANKLPKIVVPVHMCGLPCDMQAIGALADRYGFSVIEDASHAIGGRYMNEPIGNGRYSDITVFSFHPVKNLTTGEGGLAVTNDEALAKTMQLLRSHGITREAQDMTQVPDGPWYYQQIELGYNYRMTDFQAALGLSQLRRLDMFVKKRHAIAKRYTALLQDFALRPQAEPETCFSAYHLYNVRLDLDELKSSRLHIVEQLRNQDIGVNVHYIPVHLQPWYQKLGFRQGDFPAAERFYEEALSLPLYPDLTELQQDEVVDRLREAMYP